ncbi:DMT family transporter [uncultured Shimia sp.]|uniref:DMT family transporter n=1 Tax=uncultured Shimia sp. TaxID=573152 RepID=UPI00261B726C|nr:DMT family transporter [uncultured Shimia sp.]
MSVVSVRVLGGVVVLSYTLVLTGADVLIKVIAQSYPAAQLFGVSCMVVVMLSLVSVSVKAHGNILRVSAHLRTRYSGFMVLRCGLGLLGAFGFYHGFRLLPLAEMFLFIGMIPLGVAVLSGPVLHEPVRATAWAALAVGSLGVACLFVDGGSVLGSGHAAAVAGCVTSALSMVLARWMTQREGGCLAQVFWPNLAAGLVMLAILPFVAVPMPISDVLWACLYGAVMFVARWLCMVALTLLPAYVATPLMNIQFVWAVFVGSAVFGESISGPVVLGGTLVVVGGLVLVADMVPATIKEQTVAA